MADTAKLSLENQDLSKEITAKTDYRKRVVLPCLAMEKLRLARLNGKKYVIFCLFKAQEINYWDSFAGSSKGGDFITQSHLGQRRGPIAS